MRWLGVVAVVAAGCGRLGFEPRARPDDGGNDDGGDDGSGDGAPTGCALVDSSLIAWWSADAAGLPDGSIVTSLRDLGPRDITLTGTGNEPRLAATAFAGHAALRFTGIGGALRAHIPVALLGGNTSKSIFVVDRLFDGTTEQVLVHYGGFAAMELAIAFGDFGGAGGISLLQADCGGPGDNGIIINGLEPTVPTLWTGVKDVNAHTLFQNGTQLGGRMCVPSDITNDGAPNFTIGLTGNGFYPHRGDVAEVVIYNRALAATERVAIETCLIAKYAL